MGQGGGGLLTWLESWSVSGQDFAKLLICPSLPTQTAGSGYSKPFH